MVQQIKQTFVDKDDKRMFFLKKFVIVEQENKNNVGVIKCCQKNKLKE